MLSDSYECFLVDSGLLRGLLLVAPSAMATEVAVEDLRSARPREQRAVGKVEQYMTRDPICFRRDTPLEDALRALIEHKISGAPVVEPYDGDSTGSGRLVGVISEEDLLWKEVDATDKELETAFRAPYLWSMMTSDTSMLETYEDQALKVLSQTVGLSMSEQSISVTPDTPVKDAATIMLDAKIKRLPVVAPREGGRPGAEVGKEGGKGEGEAAAAAAAAEKGGEGGEKVQTGFVKGGA
ncbi:unnamed protein product [Closterium sp. Yama58-4]|nr:unnamed protein product [Closterium sp. Yama58-4]